MINSSELDLTTCANPALVLHQQHLARQQRLDAAIALHKDQRAAESRCEPVLPETIELSAATIITVGPEQIEVFEKCVIAPPPDGLFWHLAHPATPEYGTPTRSGRLIIEGIIARVCLKYEIDLDELLSKRRCTIYVQARDEVYWFARRKTRLSFPEIARLMDGRDHTTIIHGNNRYQEARAFVAEFGVDAEYGRWDLSKIFTGDAANA